VTTAVESYVSRDRFAYGKQIMNAFVFSCLKADGFARVPLRDFGGRTDGGDLF